MDGRYTHKLKAARFFYGLMVELQNDREKFRYCLSAFLSASRSIIQYAYKETTSKENPKAKLEAKKWFEETVKASPVIKFLKKRRDVDIHITPVHPRALIKVTFHETIGVSESGELLLNGKKMEGRGEHKVPTDVSYKYFFNGWPESEDVIQVCKRCLYELEGFVKDGITNGFITE